MRRHNVGILGATGLVGQRLVERLVDHPWFELKVLAASERSAGRSYRDAVNWCLPGGLPESVAGIEVTPCEPAALAGCSLVFSALDSGPARQVEPACARAGLAVVSNSSAFRQQVDVPLVVPEVNADHLQLIGAQRGPGSRGFIVTNPNCSTTGLVVALAPLHRAFGVRRVVVTTLQALSGAGVNGPRALELVDNVVPHISGEEEKLEVEMGKILGNLGDGEIRFADITVSAHCHRVGVIDGHLEAVSVELNRQVSLDEVATALREFRGAPQELELPSAPERPILVRDEPDRPQPGLDRDEGDGMTVVVGRIRACPVLGVKLSVLSHNAVRGAAGGTLLNAELIAARGWLDPRSARVIVMKFGGTSLADAERILAVAEIVRSRAAQRPVVVVSALGRVTDLLERAIASALGGERETLEPILADLERCHRWALAGCVETAGARHDLTLEVDRIFDDLRGRLRSMRILEEGTPRAADAVLAMGEALSSRIVAAAFRDRGLDATWVEPSAVVQTDARFGSAEPDLDRSGTACGERLVPLLDQGRIPVVGGFVGASPDGATTTLGRGGSDTSAAVIGLLLDAREIQIWTDVDGLMSADPRLVPSARTLQRVSFSEAAELAFYGAKVLHPDSIAPAVQRMIPVRILNSMRPEGAGTLVVGENAAGDAGAGAPRSESAPVAVASRCGVRLLRVSARRVRADPGFLARVLAACAGHGIGPELVLASEVAVSLATSSPVDCALLESDLGGDASCELLDDRAIACVVGSALVADHELRARVVAELARWQPDIVVTGGSLSSVAAVVPRHALEGALRRLHERFFETSAA